MVISSIIANWPGLAATLNGVLVRLNPQAIRDFILNSPTSEIWNDVIRFGGTRNQNHVGRVPTCHIRCSRRIDPRWLLGRNVEKAPDALQGKSSRKEDPQSSGDVTEDRQPHIVRALWFEITSNGLAC